METTTVKPEIQIDDKLKQFLAKEDAINHLKPSLFNLLIYTRDPNRIPSLEGLVQNIIEKFPCRILFLILDHDGNPDRFEAKLESVSAPKSESSISCDQIRISAGRNQIQRIPFFVLPSLIPDLPIHLVWSQEPGEDEELLNSMIPNLSRLIFDSSVVDDLSKLCSHALEAMSQYSCEIVDITWARMSGWRNVFLQIFDDQDAIDHLIDAEEVRIDYCGNPNDPSPKHSIEAYYLQSWLAERLGWDYVKRDGDIVYSKNSHNVNISLNPKENTDFPKGCLLDIEIKSKTGWSYHIQRFPSTEDQVRVEISSDDHCELPFYLPLFSSQRGHLFAKELLYSHQSSHYIQMLTFIIDQI